MLLYMSIGFLILLAIILTFLLLQKRIPIKFTREKINQDYEYQKESNNENYTFTPLLVNGILPNLTITNEIAQVSKSISKDTFTKTNESTQQISTLTSDPNNKTFSDTSTFKILTPKLPRKFAHKSSSTTDHAHHYCSSSSAVRILTPSMYRKKFIRSSFIDNTNNTVITTQLTNISKKASIKIKEIKFKNSTSNQNIKRLTSDNKNQMFGRREYFFNANPLLKSEVNTLLNRFIRSTRDLKKKDQSNNKITYGYVSFFLSEEAKNELTKIFDSLNKFSKTSKLPLDLNEILVEDLLLFSIDLKSIKIQVKDRLSRINDKKAVVSEFEIQFNRTINEDLKYVYRFGRFIC
jgi:hypothetical protein